MVQFYGPPFMYVCKLMYVDVCDARHIDKLIIRRNTDKTLVSQDDEAPDSLNESGSTEAELLSELAQHTRFDMNVDSKPTVRYRFN